MRFLKIVGYILFIFLLTIFTQVGGVILALCLPVFVLIRNKFNKRYWRWLTNTALFLTVYLLITFFVLPPVAKSFGRVPLPLLSHEAIKPLNIMTCLLNRHYVVPVLKNNIESVAEKINRKYPGAVISYLDANFPFFDGFPMLPHLSHSDGKKVDIAFFYKDRSGNELNHKAPSFIGYGVYETPENNEYDMPKNCHKKGYEHYSILEKIVPQWNTHKMIFDPNRTKHLIRLFTQEKTTSKIFIEPHLKTRMHIQSDKVRFQGCRAVRHDDHVHLQIE